MSTGVWRPDVKNEGERRFAITGIVKRSKTDSTSFVKNQSECGRARGAKPEIFNSVEMCPIRSCWSEPQSKDPSHAWMSKRPGALEIGTFHNRLASSFPVRRSSPADL